MRIGGPGRVSFLFSLSPFGGRGGFFAVVDFSQQFVESCGGSFENLPVGVRSFLEKLVQPIGSKLELLQVLGGDRLAGSVLDGLNLACDPVSDLAFAVLFFCTHGPTAVDPS